MSMPPIHVQRAGRRLGPFTEAELRAHLAAGSIRADDLAWFEGMGDYLPLYAVVGAWIPDLVPEARAGAREVSSDAAALAEWDAELGLGAATAPAPVAAPVAAATAARPAHLPSSVYPKVDFGTRLVAHLLDWVYAMLFLVPGLLLLLLAFTVGEGEYGEPSDALVVPAMVALLAGLAYAVWYGFTKDGNRLGAGFGKRRQGIMVVHLPTNTPATRGQSAVRQLVMLLLQLVPYVGWLVEPIALIVDPSGRRLGDRGADTQVIRTADYVAAAD